MSPLTNRFLNSSTFNFFVLAICTLIITSKIVIRPTFIYVLLAICGVGLIGYTLWYFMTKPANVSTNKQLSVYASIAFWGMLICLFLSAIPGWVLWLFIILIIVAVATFWVDSNRKSKK